MAPEHKNNRFNSNWIQNYFFVDMPATDSRYIYREKRQDAAHRLSGMLKVRLVTVDPLFIGSGFQELEGTEEGMQFVRKRQTNHSGLWLERRSTSHLPCGIKKLCAAGFVQD